MQLPDQLQDWDHQPAFAAAAASSTSGFIHFRCRQVPAAHLRTLCSPSFLFKMASAAACIQSPPQQQQQQQPQQQQQQQQPEQDQQQQQQQPDQTTPIDIPRLPIESGDEANLTLSMTTEDDADVDVDVDADLDPDTLDLSSQELAKLSRATPECTLATMTLILDNNSLQRLDNIHTYQCIEKVRSLNLSSIETTSAKLGWLQVSQA